MRVTKVIKQKQLLILEDVYKDAKPALLYNTPFELLIAVVLSAQCTDVRVNIITRRLFPTYSNPLDMYALGTEKLEPLIRDCGLYRAKAAHIIGLCKMLIEEYNCEVPNSFEELIKLPGVGRKTANVVMSIAFGMPAIAVDTHVFRVANRLKLGIGKTPLEVEEKLMKAIPKDKWSKAHHWLIWHGRKICKARNPLCYECPLKELCPSAGLEGPLDKPKRKTKKKK